MAGGLFPLSSEHFLTAKEHSISLKSEGAGPEPDFSDPLACFSG
jgi:hypothetical protein